VKKEEDEFSQKVIPAEVERPKKRQENHHFRKFRKSPILAFATRELTKRRRNFEK
jgi:hypothetical protein